MAGTIIADKIQTENSFLTLNVGQTLVATINSSGILNSSGGTMIGANGSVSNTAITGLVTASQIANVANTQLTGLIQAAQIGSANATLITSGTLPGARLPTGSVLQVVYGSTSSAITITNASTGLISTGLSASITPSSISSKILVIVSHGDTASNQSGNGVQFAIFRNNVTNLIKFANQHAYGTVSGSNLIIGGPSTSYLDSPATTSSTTYGTYFTVNANGGVSGTTQRDSTVSSITLMEIAA